MKIEYTEHYNKDYWTRKKTYHDKNGIEQVYTGPSLTWDGFEFVADALEEIFPQDNMSVLNIGCSAGDLDKRMLARGFNNYGIDISEYAVENCVPEMKDRIALADISKPETFPITFPEKYDLVMATDLLEHLYLEDLDQAFKAMMDRSKRWMFFLVATALDKHCAFTMPDEFILKKGEVVPPQHERTAVSGHVTVLHWKKWVTFFLKKGLKIRWDLMYLFQMQREMNNEWHNLGGWNHSCTWILEKCK